MMGKRDARAVAEEIRRRAGLNGTHHAHHAAEDVPTGEEEPPPGKEKMWTAADVATIEDLEKAGAEVEWLWEGWLANRVCVAMAAIGGMGKTRLCCDLVRRIKFGLPWPDGKPMTLPPAARVLWVVSDNHHDQLVTVCRKWDIRSNVVINAWKKDPYEGTSLMSEADFNMLNIRAKLVEPAIIVVDTVGNSTDKNLAKQEDAMAYYKPLQEIARKRKCCMLCLTHLSAGGQIYGRRAREKVRVVLYLTKPDPESDKLALHVDKTFDKTPKPLGVTLKDDGYEYDDKPPEAPPMEPGQQGYGQQDGQQARRGRGRPPRERDAAAEWLRARLANGPERAPSVIDAGEEAGHDSDTLFRAMRQVGEQVGEKGSYMWRLKPAAGAGEEEV
jgi:hypothetical protein